MSSPDQPAIDTVAGAGGVAAAAGATPGGSIYDLGYRRYDGPRLGRRHAVLALYFYSVRGTFGLGRSGRAKVAPFGLAFLALLPALISVGITALVGQAGAGSVVESPVRHATYLSFSATVLVLFCAAQAPELVGRDQRYNVLPLYFSRALRRSDYALTKLGALWTALAAVFLVPQLLIFAGRVLASPDIPTALAGNVGAIPPVLAVAAMIALVLGSLSLAIASFTPRRAYATAAIIATFIVPPIVAAIIAELSRGPVTIVAALLDPSDLLDAGNSVFFSASVQNDVVTAAGLPGVAVVATLAVYSIVSAAITIRRYLGISA